MWVLVRWGYHRRLLRAAAVVTAAGGVLAISAIVWTDAGADRVPVQRTASPSVAVRFTTPIDVHSAGNALTIAIADFNADGHADLATANRFSMSVLLGTGGGGFRPPQIYPAHARTQSLAAGDLNEDGRPDLALTKYSRSVVSVFLARTNGSFTGARDYRTDYGPYGVAIADLNLDHHLDLVVANWDDVSVSALLGRGDGTFRPQISHREENDLGNNPLGNILYVAAGDLNGDDRPDVAAADEFDSVWVVLGRGDGSFGSAARNPAHDTPGDVAMADLNGDGRLDLVVANVNSSDMSVLLGRGDGTFGRTKNYRLAASGSGTYDAAVADLNGDGRPDVAAANDLADVSVALGRGDGSFLAAAHYAMPRGGASVAIGDLNGDTLPDLAIGHGDTEDVSVLLQTTATPPQITINGLLRRGCTKRFARIRVQVTSETALSSVSVFLDRKRIKSTTNSRFTIRLPGTAISARDHMLRGRVPELL
jgi:FG-GAP-like repeat